MGAVVELHLADMRLEGRRPGTVTQRAYALGRLQRALGQTPILDATAAQVKAHISRPMGDASRAVEITHLRRFYQWAIYEGHLDIDPTARLRRPPVRKRVPRPMATEDLAMAIDLAPPRVKPWLVLAAYAGLRCCEIAPLRTDDIWRHAIPRPVLLLRDPKGGGEEAVVMSARLVTALDRCDLPASGPLFRMVDGRPMAPHRISQVGNNYLRSIGVDATMHQARHWFGTTFYRLSGHDLRATQEAMRHATTASTEVYTALDPGRIADTLELFPALSNHPQLPFDVAV